MSSESRFDVVIIGTGLSESIAAASLAKEGLAILQLDRNEFYGDRHASLTVTELMDWLDAIGPGPGLGQAAGETARPWYNNASYDFPSRIQPAPTNVMENEASAVPVDSFQTSLPRTSRLYSLSLYPSLLPSRGALVNTLVHQDVGKYVSFRTVDSIGISGNTSDSEPGTFVTLPSSKESIFKDPGLALMDKRRLMKCLMWVGDEARSIGLADDDEEGPGKGQVKGGDDILTGKETMPFLEFLSSAFSLPPRLAETIAFGIAHCSIGTEPALPAIQRMNKYLRSAGRYAPGPFLVGQYGGAGEVVQAFCRSCAVYGGTYILGESSKMSDFRVLAEPIPPVPSPVETTAVDNSDSPLKATLPARISFSIPAFDEPVLAGHIICAPDAPFLPPSKGEITQTRNNCIAIVDSLPIIARSVHTSVPDVDPEDDVEQVQEESQRDVFMLVIKPEKVGEQSVRVLFMGPATGSCPEGQYVMYIQSSGSQELTPILERLYPTFGPQPLFIARYTTLEYAMDQEQEHNGVELIRLHAGSGLVPIWLEGLDAEVMEAERLVASCLAI